MATSTAKFQTVLDSTKLAVSKWIRKPPIDPKAPIQGKVRNPASNAFKEHAFREAIRLRKALNSIEHGKNIFVYHNVRTKQVVYSLTRALEKTNVLHQMVYHGKKTVPAEIRRDLWVPYYSVHFTSPKMGLRAFHLLREFSMQRQLAPPQEMITVTKQFLDSKRPKDPVEAEKFDRINTKRIGQTMEKKERARVLMDQRATSVADIAAVLDIHKQDFLAGVYDRDGKRGYLTRAARQRRREALKADEQRQKDREARVQSLEDHLSSKHHENGMEVRVDRGEISPATEVEAEAVKPAETAEPAASAEAVAEEGAVESDELSEARAAELAVKLLWRDAHDAHYAEKWSEHVKHGQLKVLRSDIVPAELLSDNVLAEDEFAEEVKKA